MSTIANRKLLECALRIIKTKRIIDVDQAIQALNEIRTHYRNVEHVNHPFTSIEIKVLDLLATEIQLIVKAKTKLDMLDELIKKFDDGIKKL